MAGNNNFLQPLGPLVNAADTLLSGNSGTVPDMSDAIRDLFQQITFAVIGKSVNGTFTVQEQATNLVCYGVLIPVGRQLDMTKDGQRAWRHWEMYTDLSVQLFPDDVITYLGDSFRVMRSLNYNLYGFRKYDLVENYTGSGPYLVAS